jgi:ribosome modulation factor
MARGRQKATAPDVDGKVRREVFVEHFDLVTEKLRLKKEADSALSNAYRAAERAGIDRKMLKQVRVEADLTAEERAINEKRRRLYLTWLNKPVGFQSEMEVAPVAPVANGHAEPPDETDQKHASNEAYEWGVSAGKAGAATDSCPYPPGSEEAQSWRGGWGAGQKIAVESLGGATA